MFTKPQKNQDSVTGGLQVFNEYEAAHRLGVSVYALRKWRFERRGPAFVKLGMRVGYIEKDLSNYLESARIETKI